MASFAPCRAAQVVTVCAALITALPASAQIIHGPRLGLVTADTATISWDTACSAADTLHYGTGGLSLSVTEAAATTRHRVTVSDLTPDTTYTFRVKSCGGSSAVHAFTSAPTAPGGSFKFVSMADSRGKSDTEDMKALSPAFIRILADADRQGGAFVMHVGDIFYGYSPFQSVFQALYERFKFATDPIASRTPFLVNPGGHEMSSWNKKDPTPATTWNPITLFNEHFAQPTLLSGHPGTVYSWDHGDSHFVSIDTSHFDASDPNPNHGVATLDQAQIDWLEADLQAHADARFIFVFGHHHAWRQADSKLFYLGTYTPELRTTFWNLLESHRVTAYVCGHEHLFDDSLGPPHNRSVVQWLNGNSGAPPDDPNGTAKYEYTVWEIAGDTATARLLDDSGREHYRRTFPRRAATGAVSMPNREVTP